MSTATILKSKADVSNVETGIEAKDRKVLADGLSVALADTYLLYLKTQGTHWNVVGPLFYGLHKLTEEQYEDLADAIDAIAERIRAIGYPAPASFGEFSEISGIKENREIDDAETMVRHLVQDNETIAKSLREVVQKADEMDDVYTADLLTARIGEHEESAWMLRSLTT